MYIFRTIGRVIKLLLAVTIAVIAVGAFISSTIAKYNLVLSNDFSVYGRQLNINTYELIILEKPNNLNRFVYSDNSGRRDSYSNTRYKISLHKKWDWFGLSAREGITDCVVKQSLIERDRLVNLGDVIPDMPNKAQTDFLLGKNYIVYDGNEYLRNNYPEKLLWEFEEFRDDFYDNKNSSL